MSDTESDATKGASSRKRGAKPESQALPPAGAESEPKAAEPAPEAAPDSVTVDAAASGEPDPEVGAAAGSAPRAPVTVDAVAEPEPDPEPGPATVDAVAGGAPAAATASVASRGAEPAPEAHEEAGEEEGGRSVAAWLLGFLVLLIAGAALGIWGAPKVAPMLPAGMKPVADWLTPGKAETEAQVAALQARVDRGLTDVDARIAALPSAGDLDARIDTAVSAAEGRVDASVAALKQTVDQLGTSDASGELAQLGSALDGQKAELAALKDQLSGATATTGQLNQDAVQKIDVYRAELDGLRAEVGKLQDSVGSLGSRLDEVAASANREIETAQSKVSEIQAAATTATTAAQQQAAIAQIRAAMASGQPFAAAIKALGAQPGLAVPDGLAAAADSGVPTMAQLRDSFPDAAHAALRASIMAAAGNGIFARARAYLESQIASRSLTPQAGVGPDAVLSRMEDALRQNNLTGALDESTRLPSESAAAMSDWLEKARLRSAADQGLATLDATLPATN